MFKNKKLLAIFFAIIAFCTLFSGYGCSKDDQNRTSYQIDCELNGNVLTASQTVNFYNHTENAFSKIKFNLFANAFREGASFSPISSQYSSRAYPNGVSYGDIQITLVKVGEKEASFSIGGEDKNILIVDLENQVFPAESVCIYLEYKVTLASVVARTGINADTINLANFYPVLCGIQDGAFYECIYYSTGDPFFSDCADYVVNFTCNKSFKVASSGQKIEESALSSDKIKHSYKIQNARNFAFVLSEKFKVAKASVRDVEILYYYYGDEKVNESLDVIKKSINYFSEQFGEYAYKTYSVCETQFLQGGMEFTALTMISDDLEPKAYKEVIVHETAHMWWMSAVGNNEIEYGFLDEGSTEYSVILFYENHPEYQMKREVLVVSAEQTYKAFCTVSEKLFESVDTSMLRPLGAFKSEYEYVNVAYIKPCIMYDTLRTTVGDSKFFTALKNYYENYKFKVSTPDELIGAFEKAGANSNGYFESFFNGKVII